jgi:rare lipoprotein A
MVWRPSAFLRWCLLAAVSCAVGCSHSSAIARPAEPARVQRVQRIQLGLASYYGPGFHGQKTASGEIFDQWEMVAAHRWLPLGTVVRVTNLGNGRSVVLRVIDRGPYGANYRKGTIIDVSRGAARKLGFLQDGLVRVRIEVVRRAARDRRGDGSSL